MIDVNQKPVNLNSTALKIFESGGAEAENPRDCGPTVGCDFRGACKHGTLRTQPRFDEIAIAQRKPGETQHQPKCKHVQSRKPNSLKPTLLWSGILLWIACAPISVWSQPPPESAEAWRHNRLSALTQRLAGETTASGRAEILARRNWLTDWKPGQMQGVRAEQSKRNQLQEEPRLRKLPRPAGFAANDWLQAIELQTRLLAIDTRELRKENLQRTIPLANELDGLLSRKLSPELQTLETEAGWSLAFTRYRLTRALAYRELPDVIDRWPIQHQQRYESQLQAAYQRLIEITKQQRREFILIDDRMLRRAGDRGRALELLEANRDYIDAKWYLKKRRDLLKELGWDAPHQEAARLYEPYDD